MGYDTLVDKGYLENGLEDICDAVRAKTGGSSTLAFPAGIVSAIESITGGGGAVGDYDITVTDNPDGTQSLAIVDAQGGGVPIDTTKKITAVTYNGVSIPLGGGGASGTITLAENLSATLSIDTGLDSVSWFLLLPNKAYIDSLPTGTYYALGAAYSSDAGLSGVFYRWNAWSFAFDNVSTSGGTVSVKRHQENRVFPAGTYYWIAKER